VVNDHFGGPITDTIKFAFGDRDKNDGPFVSGELKSALKGSNLDFREGRSNGDDLQRLLDEAFEDDGFGANGIDVDVEVTALDTVTLTFDFSDEAGETNEVDVVTLTGKYIEGYLANLDENFVSNSLNIDDDVSENAFMFINNDGLNDSIRVQIDDVKRDLIDTIPKGQNIDHRGPEDDLTFLLDAAFDDPGTVEIGSTVPLDPAITAADLTIMAERTSDNTVVFTFSNDQFAGVEDTLTVTGQYIANYFADDMMIG